MIDGYERYAISWVPRPYGALARFGATWTGWCADAAERRPRLRNPRLPLSPDHVCGPLERQGLHGIIRAPFRLRERGNPWRFERVLCDLAEGIEAFPLPRLKVTVVDSRISLVPEAVTPELEQFVSIINKAVEPFDAGPEKADDDDYVTEFAAQMAAFARADRRAIQLVEKGFVMPLTRNLAPEEAEALMGPLAREIEHVLAEPVQIEDFALVGDPGQGRAFRILERFPLRERGARPGRQVLACTGPRLLSELVSTRDERAVA